MSIVVQIASWAATAYLAYSFYQTGTYVYSLWTPPTCDSSQNPGQCLCGSYDEDTLLHFEVYLSPKNKLQQNFQTSTQFKRVYSSAFPPNPDNINDESEALPPNPVKVSFDSEPLQHKTFLNGRKYKLHKNKTTIYAHIISYNPPKSKSSDYYYTSSIPTDYIFSSINIPVTYFDAPPPDTFSLQTGKSGKEQQENIKTTDNKPLVDMVQYFQPNLTIFYVVDFNCYPIRTIPHDVFPYLRSQRFSARQRNQRQTVSFLFIRYCE